ncbi:hypothetical protein B0H13DRAFT_2334033 [Mycena leptocephala]|nr:hypothetical protein B0H13DRAFT_2334033 [Mycena leptocephala]
MYAHFWYRPICSGSPRATSPASIGSRAFGGLAAVYILPDHETPTSSLLTAACFASACFRAPVILVVFPHPTVTMSLNALPALRAALSLRPFHHGCSAWRLRRRLPDTSAVPLALCPNLTAIRARSGRSVDAQG